MVLLPGQVEHPQADHPARLPAVVFVYPDWDPTRSLNEFHGGTVALFPHDVLVSRGVVAVLVSCPLTPLHQKGNLVREIADAVLPQIYEAANRGLIDIRRVAVMGHSFGGFVTLALITQTNLFRAAIAVDPVPTDLVGSHSLMRGSGARYYWPELAGRMESPPWSDFLRYVLNSPYLRVDRIRTPVLLVHGERDDSAPLQETEKFFNALKRDNRAAELAVYSGEGHVPAEWAHSNAVDAATRALTFIQRHILATSQD